MKVEKTLCVLLFAISSIAVARITEQEYWSPIAKRTAENGLETIRLYSVRDQSFASIENDDGSSEFTRIKNGLSMLSGTNSMGNAFWLVSSTNAAAIRYGEYIGAENDFPPRFCMAVFDSEGKMFEFAATTNTIGRILSDGVGGVYMRFRRSGAPSYFTCVIFSQFGPCNENSEMFRKLGLSSVDSFYMTEEAVAKAELGALVDGEGALAQRLSMYYVVCEQNTPMNLLWLYVGNVLGNDVCRNNLAYDKNNHGVTEETMFRFLPADVKWYGQRYAENPDDIVAAFFLLKHYESSGDRENASKYAAILKKEKINELLLKSIK